VCDLGCGVGSLAIPLAQRGAVVAASDISSSMAQEAGRRAAEMGIDTATFEASDLESVRGSNYCLFECVDGAPSRVYFLVLTRFVARHLV
jgi:magnesium-protoporphyrin O-methyltransferase